MGKIVAFLMQGDALPLSADALVLLVDTLALSADALALQGIAKFNLLRIDEMLYLIEIVSGGRRQKFFNFELISPTVTKRSRSLLPLPPAFFR